MKSIIYVGMDVHSTNYTLASYTFENDWPFAVTQVEPDYKHILNYLKQVQKNYGGPCEFLCGYEAGCLGFTLYEQLKSPVVPFGQGFASMSPPTKELMKLVLEQKIAHGGHPVLRWNMDNIFIRTDPAGDAKLVPLGRTSRQTKQKARRRLTGRLPSSWLLTVRFGAGM